MNATILKSRSAVSTFLMINFDERECHAKPVNSSQPVDHSKKKINAMIKPAKVNPANKSLAVCQFRINPRLRNDRLSKQAVKIAAAL